MMMKLLRRAKSWAIMKNQTLGKSIQQQIKDIPAVFPTELASRVIQFYSFKGDLIFDPFGGSGTVGRVAMDQDRYFLLCEKEPKYVEYVKKTWDASLLYASKFKVLSLDRFKK